MSHFRLFYEAKNPTFLPRRRAKIEKIKERRSAKNNIGEHLHNI
jgi:hypothetical protein